MSILSYKFGEFGEVGVTPRKVYITCNDVLADVITEGYADGLIAQGNNFFTTDEVHINYGTSSELFNIFTPTIDGLTVTLNPSITVGNVTTPVVSGNIPKFSGTDGLMVDSGISPSNAAKTKMVMANAATVANNLVMATDTTGTIGDSGINLKFGLTAAYSGGSAVHTYTATGLTASYSAIGMLIASENVVEVAYAVPGTNNITVTFSGDPGTGAVVFWIAIKTS